MIIFVGRAFAWKRVLSRLRCDSLALSRPWRLSLALPRCFAVPGELLQSPTRSLFHAVVPSLSFTFLFLCSDRGAVCDIHSLWLHFVHSIWLLYPQDRPAEERVARTKSSRFCAITVGSHDNRWKSGCRLDSVRETPHFPTSPLANAVILSPSNIPTLVWFYVAYTFLFPCHTHSVVVTCMCFSSPSGYSCGLMGCADEWCVLISTPSSPI